jgi:hypothetical protein
LAYVEKNTVEVPPRISMKKWPVTYLVRKEMKSLLLLNFRFVDELIIGTYYGTGSILNNIQIRHLLVLAPNQRQKREDKHCKI